MCLLLTVPYNMSQYRDNELTYVSIDRAIYFLGFLILINTENIYGIYIK